MYTETEILADRHFDLLGHRNVLVFSPHPDDESFGPGGTLASMSDNGVRVQVVLITTGSSPEDLLFAEDRYKESVASAKILGIHIHSCLHIPDRQVEVAPDLEERIYQTISEISPDLIFTPSPGEIHTDHRATTQAVLNVIKTNKTKSEIAFYEVSNLITNPNWLVNITEVVARKKQSIKAFTTQAENQNYAEHILGLNAYRSYHLRKKNHLAEAFFIFPSSQLDDHLEIFSRENWDFLQLKAEKNRLIHQLEDQLQRQKKKIQITDQLEYEVRRLNGAIAELESSTSWQLTRPLREAVTVVREKRARAKRFYALYNNLGGLKNIFLKVLHVLRHEGFSTLHWRITNKLAASQLVTNVLPEAADVSYPKVVPYFIDPKWAPPPRPKKSNSKIAIHLHLYYTDQISKFVDHFKNVGKPFDLFVSVPDNTNYGTEWYASEFRNNLNLVVNITVEKVPNQGRDLAPMIITFSKRLLDYDIVGHFHTKKSPHNPALQSWCQEILDLLTGKRGLGASNTEEIFDLLNGKASIVYAQAPLAILEDRTGWASNKAVALSLSKFMPNINVKDFDVIEYPRGSMFWADVECLKPLLNLPLRYIDFPEEPISEDGTLAHAIERILLILTTNERKLPHRLHNREINSDYRLYENQIDFSDKTPSDIKALAYYLPQFHTTPENDKWHGTGFTEWTNVQRTNPLFVGHHQQHIPHEDLGYYTLEDPGILEKQASMMRKAGISGMVFYHYWFSGKLILEKPVNTLLERPDIDMPFAFCWANENWTRKWDGNEQEVLLRQVYSEEDAKNFIRHLLPFFKDSRYIKIDERPVLFIYRPSHIPPKFNYVNIWRDECERNGLNPPFLVATLTRGTKSAAQHSMDASVERVLHDWVGGKVAERKSKLMSYQPLEGSVLDYTEVADFYSTSSVKDSETIFRSIVPQWDNSPRYGRWANILNGSTPKIFADWFKTIILDTRNRLPESRRFILINAWNEWAEGAHLEPDERYGYAYLNSVGRALHGKPIDSTHDSSDENNVDVVLDVAEPALEWFAESAQGKSILDELFNVERVRVFSTDPHFIGDTRITIGLTPKEPIVLKIKRPMLIKPGTIKSLIKGCLSEKNETVVLETYSDESLIESTDLGTISRSVAFDAPIISLGSSAVKNGVKKIRLLPGLSAFPQRKVKSTNNQVSTIVRFHNEGDITLLSDALMSLASQNGIIVHPVLLFQNPTEEKFVVAERLVNSIPWPDETRPKIIKLQSNNLNDDLRARALLEGMSVVDSRYVSFLDYDDLMFPNAFRYLIERLIYTKKSISFGRIYETFGRHDIRKLMERKRTYEFGTSYSDFIKANCTPIHGFMIDLKNLNKSTLYFKNNQKYLEDYCLTLQIFQANNADWDSLKLNQYIGDYRHCVDKYQTLAVTDKNARALIVQTEEYRQCAELSINIKKAIMNGTNLSTFANKLDLTELNIK